MDVDKSQHEVSQVITPRPLIIKGNDGEPLLRKTIQYDFLQALFEDPTQCFTEPSLPAPNNKVTFNALYRKALINSTKMTGSQRVKMEQFQDFGLVMAQVCLLTNVGRINTTLAFYPDMRTALRYYHSIPSLQRDDTTRQHMYDAARMKTVLKGCIGNENPPVATPQDILNRQATGFSPACNPVAALFAFTAHSALITKDHFKDCEFMDLFLPGPYPSQARARALLWLLYRYLEDAKGPNPFQDPAARSQKFAPPVPRISMEEMELENIDTPEELDYGRRMLQYRIEFLNKTEAEYAQDAAKGKVDPNVNIRGQRAIKKKAAIGRAVQEELAALETQSNLSRDSSLPPTQFPPGLAIGALDGGLHAAVSSSGVSALNPQQVILTQTEQNARHLLAQPPAVNLYTHAMNRMVNAIIDSDDEDTETHAQVLLDRRLAILHTFCTPPVPVLTPPA
ncbi:hypothetical protein M408DRAFT_325362 [Serendipita vermifera MAFF 305830]|uniref:Ino eighty subunit 1 n=1 Tax=Serendipita vermifera MAFF 305830 TaxID=933852 RepID=A0A0C2X6P4_SERVB|nr:hypothetical protein M408DRAFT_325362 [Serendipita vermifera MAFF 305830]